MPNKQSTSNRSEFVCDNALPPVTGISRELARFPCFDNTATRIAFLGAPAGYGKSTVAAAYYQQFSAHKAWLRILPTTAQLADVVAELQQRITSAFGLDALPISDDPIASLHILPSALANFASGLIVIDDVHLIALDQQQRFLLTLIQMVPRHIQLIFTSREPLPDYLIHRVVAGELHYITATALRLAPDECEAIIARQGIARDAAESARLYQYFDGWLGGIVLWCSTAKSQPVSVTFAPSVTPLLLGYVQHEILQTLSPDLTDFLVASSVISEMDAEFLALLSGNKKDWLAELQHRQLFLLYSSESSAFCYANFFRDVLREKLSTLPKHALLSVRTLALDHLLRHQRLDDATVLAKQANDPALIVRVIEASGWRMYHQAQHAQLSELLNGLSKADVFRSPAVFILYLWWLIEIAKKPTAANEFYALAAEHLKHNVSEETWRAIQHEIIAVRAYQAANYDCFVDAENYLLTLDYSALSENTHAIARYTDCWTQLLLGKITLQNSPLVSLTRKAHSQQQFHTSLRCRKLLSQMYWYNGAWETFQRHQAETLQYTDNFDLRDDHILDSFYRVAMDHALATGNLQQAQIYADLGSEIYANSSEYWHLPRLTRELALEQAKNEIALLDDKARQLTTMLPTTAHVHKWVADAEYYLLSYWSKTQRYDAITAWLNAYEKFDSQAEIHHLQQQVAIMMAKLVVRQAPDVDVLAAFAAALEERGLMLFAKRIQLVRAIVLFELNPPDVGDQSLRELVSWYAERGAVLDWQILGSRVIPLICYAEKKFVTANTVMLQQYLSRLLALIYATPPSPKASASSTQIPARALALGLTKGEWRVLQLIGQRYSNEQIAASLFVARCTVKTHVNRIYQKLQVSSRLEAYAMVQEIVASSTTYVE